MVLAFGVTLLTNLPAAVTRTIAPPYRGVPVTLVLAVPVMWAPVGDQSPLMFRGRVPTILPVLVSRREVRCSRRPGRAQRLAMRRSGL